MAPKQMPRTKIIEIKVKTGNLAWIYLFILLPLQEMIFAKNYFPSLKITMQVEDKIYPLFHI
jgi:hypothetical protein